MDAAPLRVLRVVLYIFFAPPVRLFVLDYAKKTGALISCMVLGNYISTDTLLFLMLKGLQ